MPGGRTVTLPSSYTDAARDPLHTEAVTPPGPSEVPSSSHEPGYSSSSMTPQPTGTPGEDDQGTAATYGCPKGDAPGHLLAKIGVVNPLGTQGEILGTYVAATNPDGARLRAQQFFHEYGVSGPFEDHVIRNTHYCFHPDARWVWWVSLRPINNAAAVRGPIAGG